MNKKNVVLLGDSIMRGVLLNEEKKYTFTKSINWFDIENKLNINIKNLSKMGCCSNKGFEIFDNYLKKNTNIDYLIIEYGGNDCDRNWKEVSDNPNIDHYPIISIEEFENNIIRIINLAKNGFS